MNRGVIIFVLLAILVGTANGQKLWEKVFNQTSQNMSFTTDSDMANDSIIVVSGFDNALSCHAGIIYILDITGNIIEVHKASYYADDCGYFNCFGTFRFVKATESNIYSFGEVSIDDVISGDEPIFLRKFDMDGKLKFSVAHHNTELWGHYPIWKTLGMDACDEAGVIVVHATTIENIGVTKFDTDGNVQWDRLYDFPVLDIAFTENGEFALYTGSEINLASESGDLLKSFDVQPGIHSFYYHDKFLYFSDSASIVRLGLDNGLVETIFSVDEGGIIWKINTSEDNIWVAYKHNENMHVLSVLHEKVDAYKLPIPAITVNNFFITRESIIITGTSVQGQMAVVAYGREELEPVVDWADLELIDFEISNSTVHYENYPGFDPIVDHITFDTQITIKNNGTDTIHSFGLQSDRDGGFNCVRHFYYKYFDGFTIAPGQTKVIDIGSSTDFPNHSGLLANYQLCYQLLAPNARLESNIENNILCKTFDVTNVPKVDNHQDWWVYPNPTKDHIKLRLPAGRAEATFEIWDIRGKRMTSGLIVEGEKTIDVSSFPNGMYLIRAIQGERVFTRKLVKN